MLSQADWTWIDCLTSMLQNSYDYTICQNFKNKLNHQKFWYILFRDSKSQLRQTGKCFFIFCWRSVHDWITYCQMKFNLCYYKNIPSGNFRWATETQNLFRIIFCKTRRNLIILRSRLLFYLSLMRFSGWRRYLK